MNACEKMQIAKMNLRPGRGRSMENLTRMALEEMRRKRSLFICEKVILCTKNGRHWLVRREPAGHFYTPIESLNVLFV